MDPNETKPKRGKPKRLEDVLEEDSRQRTQAERMRIGNVILTAFIGLMCTAILGFSWRAWDNISTLASESLLARAERSAIVSQNRNDKEMILQQITQMGTNTAQQIEHLSASLAETKTQNSAAISELRQANLQMQKDVTSLGVKVDMITQQAQREPSKARP